MGLIEKCKEKLDEAAEVVQDPQINRSRHSTGE